MAYTFRAAGTLSSVASGTVSPGAPAGKAVGDLLLLATAARQIAETLVTPTGWTMLQDMSATQNTSIGLYARIADGGANDTPTFDWSGTSNSHGQIAAFYGGGHTDLGTIVHAVAYTDLSGGQTDIPNNLLTVTLPNCLIVGVGKKGKTGTTDGATLTSPSGLGDRIGQAWTAGSVAGFVWDYTIQTSAANVAASVWNTSLDESIATASILVALKPAAITIPVFMNQYRHRRA